MAKTHKTIDLWEGYTHLVCIKTYAEKPVYRLYRVSNNHRTQLIKTTEFMDVMTFMYQFFLYGVDTFDSFNLKKWCKNFMDERKGIAV